MVGSKLKSGQMTAPRKYLTCAVLAIVAAWEPLPAAAASDARPLTAGDLIKIRTITDTRLSPDGTRIAYVVSRADLEANVYRTSIFLIDARSGATPRRLTEESAAASAPQWSPDGIQIAYLSDADGPSQIWLVDQEGKAPCRLTNEKQGVKSFAWSPDGSRIGYRASPPAAEDPKPVVRLVDSSYDLPQIHLLNVRTGAERQLTHGNFLAQDLDWSPDGRHIAFTYRPTPRALDEFNTDIYIVDTTSGEMRLLVAHPGRNTTPKWSRDGTRIAYVSTAGVTGAFASDRVLVVPSTGGKPRDVSPEIGERGYGFYGWSSDDRSLYFRVRHGVSMQVYAADLRTGRTREITTGQVVYDSPSFSEGREPRMAFVMSTPTIPKDLYVSALTSFHPIRVLISNPEIENFRFPQTRLIHWRAHDGLALEGVLTLPIGYDPKKRYPLVVYVHGGPPGAFCFCFAPQFSSSAEPQPQELYPPQLFAERGFAVFMPNIRGSAGYGEQFRAADVNDWGGEDLQDILSGVDELVHQGIADDKRLGVMGWSYGGFMSAYLITQTDRFRAASVGAGITDLISMYGVTDQPDQIEAYFGGPPWARPDLYRGRSAIYSADAVKTPTLIQQGELDEEVPAWQADELYRALVRQGVPVEYARYPRSPHAPTEPRQNMDVWQRNLDWFARWLVPQ